MSPRAVLIWVLLALVAGVPVALAATSPLLAWREPVYIAAGFAGIVALALMLVQPLLAAGYLPGLARMRGRRVHRVIGALIVLAVIVHVAGLWVTSPPDVIDALLFRSPTPFSAWGVIAMAALFGTAVLALVRRRLRPRTWRIVHTGIVVVIVASTALHALLIEGAMETVTKAALCALVLIATAKVVWDLRVWVR